MMNYTPYHWIGQNGSIAVFDGQRTALAPALAPGARRRYCVRVRPPAAAGRWTLRLTLVQEAVRWFDAPPTSLWIDVPVDVSYS